MIGLLKKIMTGGRGDAASKRQQSFLKAVGTRAETVSHERDGLVRMRLPGGLSIVFSRTEPSRGVRAGGEELFVAEINTNGSPLADARRDFLFVCTVATQERIDLSLTLPEDKFARSDRHYGVQAQLLAQAGFEPYYGWPEHFIRPHNGLLQAK